VDVELIYVPPGTCCVGSARTRGEPIAQGAASRDQRPSCRLLRARSTTGDRGQIAGRGLERSASSLPPLARDLHGRAEDGEHDVGEIQSLAARRRHRVRGIAQKEHAGRVPSPHPVDDDLEDLPLRPLVEFLSRCGRSCAGTERGSCLRSSGRGVRWGWPWRVQSMKRPRFHAHVMKTLWEVAYAVRYVLENVRHHLREDVAPEGADPCSSAGWRAGRSGDEIPVSPARTWLLRHATSALAPA